MDDVPEGKSSWSVNMSLHTITTVGYAGETCVVRWSRGKHKGMTEKSAIGQDGVATMSKEVSMNITVVKRRGKIAAKNVTLEARVVGAKKTRVIGELKLDVSLFVANEPCIAEDFTMKTGLGQPPVMTISFDISPLNKACRSSDSSMESADVSEEQAQLVGHRRVLGKMVPMKRFESFGARRPKGFDDLVDQIRAEPVLTGTPVGGTSTPSTPMRSPMTRASLSGTPMTTGTPMSKVPRCTFALKSHRNSVIDRDVTANTASTENSPLSARSRSRATTLVGQDTRKSPAYDEVRSLCEMSWPVGTPVGKMFHGLDSMVFTFLVHFNALDPVSGMSELDFVVFTDDIWKVFKRSEILRSIAPSSRFLMLFGLYVLLQKPPIMIDGERARAMADMMGETLRHSLETLLDSAITAFDEVATRVFAPGFDVDEVCTSMADKFGEFRKNLQGPPIALDCVLTGLAHRLDLLLVDKLCLQQTGCNFMASIAWNTFCSRMVDDILVKGDLVRFREAVGVVQNASVINDNPTATSEICPHLPAECIVAILSVRELDEVMQEKPNTIKIALALDIDGANSNTNLEVCTGRIIDEGVRAASVDQWKSVACPPQFFQEFPFLMDYFAE